MLPRVLLIQPPIYDFSAFDFWLKPYGLLRIAGMMRGQVELKLFDFLDRFSELLPQSRSGDSSGCGKFFTQEISKPEALRDIPRRYKRFGIPREEFQNFLAEQGSYDFVLLQTGMSYWYLGLEEVIDDLRPYCPQAKIVLGGIYASICHEHAVSLGADLVVRGVDSEILWRMLDLAPDREQVPFWEGYPRLASGVLKLTDGCPFNCTYCSVPQYYPQFAARSQELIIGEFEHLLELGVRNVVFYDDALLANSREILQPFLRFVERLDYPVSFHTPNALHARLIDRNNAELIAAAGFKKVFLGVESISESWFRETGKKVSFAEVSDAVDTLAQAGIPREDITAYIILGHPRTAVQQVEQTMLAVHDLGVRIMLSEFSPIPGTPDGELCRAVVNLDQPLNHNKTAFPIRLLGVDQVSRIKTYAHQLNSKL